MKTLFRNNLKPLFTFFLIIIITIFFFKIPKVSAEIPGKAECISGDCVNGFGVMIWGKGDPDIHCPGVKYEGYFKNGILQGFGKLYTPCDGVVYFGEFANNEPNGFGYEKRPSGYDFIGQWKDWEPTGIGLTYNRGASVRLGFVEARISKGYGLVLKEDGSIEREDIYKINFTPDETSEKGEYIPKDLTDCFQELESMLTPELIGKIRAGTEDDMTQYHFGLGTWIRNSWRLGVGSRLSVYFNELGIFEPDDMSGIILRTFWRHLNKKSLELEERIKYYQEYWKSKEKP